jgi:general secretion pathway protein G
MSRAGNRGFTLIEIVITVAIIGLLAMMTLPLAELSIQRSKEQELRVALQQIREGLDAYRQAVEDGRIIQSLGHSPYPATLQVLVDGVADAKNPGTQNKMYFLRRIPRDPLAESAGLSDEETWGKRSYQSSADDPREGEDVFDVYSRSAAIGLNGIPYRSW